MLVAICSISEPEPGRAEQGFTLKERFQCHSATLPCLRSSSSVMLASNSRGHFYFLLSGI